MGEDENAMEGVEAGPHHQGGFLKADMGVQAAVAAALQRLGGIGFDNLTKTKTVARLMQVNIFLRKILDRLVWV